VDNYEWLDRIAAERGLIKPGELLADFDLALRPDIAVLAMSKGMETGAFTGRSLVQYLGADYRNARRIINGMDKADLIAGYAMQFERALIAGKWDK
jgi:hypothetical protein